MKKALLKKIFVLDLEHSQEVYIPDILSCEIYPKSFRYYDPIISITNRVFSDKSRVFHALRTDHNLTKLSRKNWRSGLLGTWGDANGGNNVTADKEKGSKEKTAAESSKMSFKH